MSIILCAALEIFNCRFSSCLLSFMFYSFYFANCVQLDDMVNENEINLDVHRKKRTISDRERGSKRQEYSHFNIDRAVNNFLLSGRNLGKFIHFSISDLSIPSILCSLSLILDVRFTCNYKMK